ncbi:MAG: hypothetical protein Q8J60_01050, partial [Thiobacillus sp.]|nr:hypothetical protein [Thiobacillus sp.]
MTYAPTGTSTSYVCNCLRNGGRSCSEATAAIQPENSKIHAPKIRAHPVVLPDAASFQGVKKSD